MTKTMVTTLLVGLLLVGLNSYPAAQPAKSIDTLFQPLMPEEPYIVDIGIKIDQIVNIDQKSENFEVVGNIWIEWDDDKLAFWFLSSGSCFLHESGISSSRWSPGQ